MGLTWWMRGVGMLYLLVSVVAIGPRVPIRAEGPPGVLDRAAAGDAVARFVVDTWTMFGLYMGAIGLSLIVGSVNAERATSLVWTVLCVEAVGGIGIDIYK